MSDSEHKVLAGILPDLTARMEKAQIRLIDKFNFENQAFRELWELLDVYYDDHMAIMPEWYLKDRALQSGMDPAKVLSLVELYKFLSSVKVNEHEFDAALQILKDDELTRKTAEALVTAREILQGEYYDDRSDKILRGQDHARAYLSESLQHMEAAGVEAAPEGDIRDDMEKLWAAYLGKEDNPHQAAGIKYGIHELDECTGGVRPGELVLVAGFTGEGKSHLVASLAWNAMRNGKNVVMFTTETTREEMEVRVLARHSRLPKFKCPGGIDSHEILSGTLSQEHKRIFRETIEDFKALDAGKLIMVQMPANGSVDYVHAKANQYNRSTQVDLIVIDSINLLRASRRYESKREMLEEILQDFKRFASSFDGGRGVAVVSPWQMSRTAWKEAVEAGGTYTLASLADTSEAEKPLRVTTPVLTPTGWVPLGDLTPGDSIIDPSTGGIQKVTKFIDRGKDSLIRLNFQDGTFSDCSPDHLWYVRTTWNGNRPLGWMTITARELKDRLDKGYRFATPIMKAPNLGEVGKASLTIPPYALGLLLGDGGFTTKTVTLTSADPQVVEEFRACLPPTLQLNSRKAKYQYGLAMTSEQRATGQGNPWIVELRRLGLFGVKSKDKFVPEDYKWASAEDRLALFQGYMDADGEATFKDTGFSTGSEALSKDMRWIAASLGIKISKERIFQPHYTHQGKRTAGSISYRTSVLAPNDMDIFRLERKRARRRQREDDVPLRYVESAEHLGEPASVACIQVSGESKLFVIDGFVVTHNCLPLDAKVLAGDGFVRMGDISPGDKIIGADSELQTVLDVHDNGVLPILEVVTQDGRVIECTPGHIWTIMHEGSVYNVEASQLEPYLNEAILPSLKTAPLLSTEGTKGLELLDPKYLAAMLREKSPVAGSLSVTTDDVEHLNQAIPTLPQYALAYSKEPEELTFIYSATSLAEDPHLLTYQEAGLLSGDITKFRIPEAYQTAHPAIREALVLALAGNPSGRLARLADRISILAKLPYDHPGFGEDLKELVWSLGLSLQGDLPRIVEVRKTTRLEETRCITVSNPDGLFVTDHFVITHNSASQIITIFKGDGIGEPGRVNIQALKHRSGSEMSKVSYPIDYRNSYIGSSNEVSQNGAKQPQAKASMVQDISSMLGL